MKKYNILIFCLTMSLFLYQVWEIASRSQRMRGWLTEMLGRHNADLGYLSDDSIRWFDFPLTEQLDEGGIPNGLLDVTHPSVVYLPSAMPDSVHNLWVALTPYPESMGGECYENTCVYSGDYDEDDGIQPTFENVHQNPIIFKEYAGFNSDPDIYYDTDDSLLYCVTRKQNCPDSQNEFVLQHSRDGQRWSEPTILFKTDKLSLCPCLFKVDDKYYIYVFNPDDYYSVNSTFDIWESSSLSNPDFHLHETCTWPQIDFGIWHGDIIRYNNCYYLLFCGFNQRYSNALVGGRDRSRYLWIARSHDGRNWQFYNKPLLKKSGLYRASMFVDKHNRMVSLFSVHHRMFGERYQSGNRIGSIRLPMAVVDSLINSVKAE